MRGHGVIRPVCEIKTKAYVAVQTPLQPTIHLMLYEACSADRLPQVKLIGKERLVLDLSCRWRDGSYWIVTDRWQRFTEVPHIACSWSCQSGCLHNAKVCLRCP